MLATTSALVNIQVARRCTSPLRNFLRSFNTMVFIISDIQATTIIRLLSGELPYHARRPTSNKTPNPKKHNNPPLVTAMVFFNLAVRPTAISPREYAKESQACQKNQQ